MKEKYCWINTKKSLEKKKIVEYNIRKLAAIIYLIRRKQLTQIRSSGIFVNK